MNANAPSWTNPCVDELYKMIAYLKGRQDYLSFEQIGQNHLIRSLTERIDELERENNEYKERISEMEKKWSEMEAEKSRKYIPPQLRIKIEKEQKKDDSDKEKNEFFAPSQF